MTFLAELKRRNVIRIGLAWLALTWLTIAIANLLLPALGIPVTAVRWLMAAMLVGWVIVLVLGWRYPLATQSQANGPTAAGDAGARVARRLDQVTVVLVLAALSLSLLHQFIAPYAQRAPAPVVAAPPAAAPAPAAPVDPHSIAVLPFANMSPDPDDAYFADGLAEELLNVLARVDGLKVTSRSSSFMFRDASLSAQDIAARLGVANLLAGSVRRQGDQVRITVQLNDAATGRQLWSQVYERDLSDIFQVQQDISQAVADALATSLGVRTVQVAAPTQDMAAYEEYLRGRQLFVQRGANLAGARELLESALARDPRFADAWAALAGTWYVWRSYSPEPAGIDTMAEAMRAADRALSLDPDHAAALAVRARIAADRGDRQQEVELIARSLAREPNNANTWLWKGLGQYEAGHLAAAHASFTRALELDPLSGLHKGWAAITMPGDRARVEAQLREAHALGWRGPASRALFLMALSTGDDVAEPYLAWLHDDDTLTAGQRELARALAPALTDAGQRADAQQRLAQAAAEHPEWEWTLMLQVFGLTDAALEAALGPDGSDDQGRRLTQWSPAYDSFRADPRFLQLAEREGLLAYWREFGPPDGCHLQESAEILALVCPRTAPASTP